MLNGLEGSGAAVGSWYQAWEAAWYRAWLFWLDVLRQKLCALRGHDQMLQFESSRMFLRCTSCGWETPGWKVGERPPRIRSFDETQRRRASVYAIARYRNTA